MDHGWYKINLSEVWLGREAIQDMHMFSNMMQKLKYGTGSFQKAKKLGYTTQYSFKVPKPSCSYVVHPAPYGCAFSIINLPANSKEYARWCLPVVIAEKNSPSFANRS